MELRLKSPWCLMIAIFSLWLGSFACGLPRMSNVQEAVDFCPSAFDTSTNPAENLSESDLEALSTMQLFANIMAAKHQTEGYLAARGRRLKASFPGEDLWEFNKGYAGEQAKSLYESIRMARVKYPNEKVSRATIYYEDLIRAAIAREDEDTRFFTDQSRSLRMIFGILGGRLVSGKLAEHEREAYLYLLGWVKHAALKVSYLEVSHDFGPLEVRYSRLGLLRRGLAIVVSRKRHNIVCLDAHDPDCGFRRFYLHDWLKARPTAIAVFQ